MRPNAEILARVVWNLAQDDSLSVEEKVNKFVAYCQKYNLFYLLPKVLFLLRLRRQRLSEEEKAKVVTALPLDKETEKFLLQLAQIDKQAELDIEENKNIIGGVIVRYRNKIFDASLKTQLEKIVRHLSN